MNYFKSSIESENAKKEADLVKIQSIDLKSIENESPSKDLNIGYASI